MNDVLPGLTACTENSKTFCLRNGPGCSSVMFPVHGVRYSRVCGRINGYQYHQPNGLGPHYHYHHTIEEGYMDGLSLTHGTSPRSHIWTFVNATRSDQYVCPCTKTDATYTGVIPPFVGTDYFCSTGSRYTTTPRWYTADPLWDGEGWRGMWDNSTCCQFNSPPWFCKNLPVSTTDDIELRVCHNGVDTEENVGVEMVDIFIQ